jgi:ABC-2 type transport system ATP-binding protein
MKENLFDETIKELEFLVEQKDFSRASRRFMDLTVEFTLDAKSVELAYSIRNSYQQAAAGNGTPSVETTSLSEDSRALIAQLLSQKEKLIAELQHTALISDIAFSGKSISKRFTSGNSPFYLQPLDLELRLGEITGVVGENGNGKTTLLRIVAGELMSDGGEISYPVLGLKAGEWYAVKNRIAFIPQRMKRWHGTLIDNLRFHATIHGIKDVENNKQVEYILNRLGLSRFRDLKWSEISSGYRLRFELAKMLMWRPRLLVLDEPLANLDINAQQLLLQDLRYILRSWKHPLAVILSSQALHEIESVADNIVFIKRGQTLYNGSQKDFGSLRSYNDFELSGSFSREQLSTVIALIPDAKLEDTGTVYHVSVPVEMKTEEFLRLLLENKILISYFRDISTSTRKLFQKDF